MGTGNRFQIEIQLTRLSERPSSWPGYAPLPSVERAPRSEEEDDDDACDQRDKHEDRGGDSLNRKGPIQISEIVEHLLRR